MANWRAYVESYPDLLAAWQQSGQPENTIDLWAARHYLGDGRKEGRQVPGGISAQELAQAEANQQIWASRGYNTEGYIPGVGWTQPTQPSQPTSNSPSTPNQPSTGFTTLVTPQPTPQEFTQAPQPSGGGNYNQVQNATQGGQFATTGQTQQLQQTTQGSTQTQQQTGTTNQTQTGTSTTGAVDTLGFGQLLKDAATGAQATDAARNTWLSDLMLNGGTAFNSQVEQAVRQSLTGPQMTGTGESARARAAGYAAADVARNNLNQRLSAAQQLAGPTQLTNLSTAANPFIGSTTSGTNTTSGTTSVTGLTDSTGWQNLINQVSEAQAGSTTAQSSQAGSGQIPEGQPVKTGGCVLCTAAIDLGLERNKRVLRRVIDYKLGAGWKSFRRAARGYFAVFGPFADYLLDHPRLAKLLYPLAKKVVYEELRVSGRSLPFRLDTWLVHWIGDGFCRLVGFLPVSGYVKQQRILDIARRENILFQVRN